MTNHKKSCFCVALGHRQRVTLKKRSRQLFSFLSVIHRSLTILSEVWGFVYQQISQLFVLYYNPYQRYYFCSDAKILYLIFCSDYNFQILFNLLFLGDRLPDLRWKGVSITCEDLVPYLIEDDSGINLGIWGTSTHKNTNNYFWRVFWYDTSNCEVCWEINPQL